MRLFLRLKIIRYLRSIGWLKEPPRSYLYNGRRYPFYKAPVHCNSAGRMWVEPEEFFNSVKTIKMIDKLKKCDPTSYPVIEKS